MSENKIINYKSTFEFASAFGVVLGLLFVGLELRHNTEAVEAATFQSLTDASNSYLLAIATNTEVLRTDVQGHNDPSKLNELETARFYFIMRSYWLRMQNVYSHWQRGTLSDHDWDLYKSVLCDKESVTAGQLATFKDHKHILSPEFIHLIQKCWNE